MLTPVHFIFRCVWGYVICPLEAAHFFHDVVAHFLPFSVVAAEVDLRLNLGGLHVLKPVRKQNCQHIHVPLCLFVAVLWEG